MRTGHKPFLLAVLFLILPFSSASSFEGPLQVKNLYPIFLHAGEPYTEKAAIENSMSYSLSHSSTYTVRESPEWVINLDMEITELNFRYRRIISDLFELNLDIPVLIFSSGFMDGFLEGYHSTFGFADYGRSKRPRNEFLYEVKRDGVLIIKGKSGTGFGDIRIGLKRPLMSSEDFHLSIKGDVEIPVSSAEKGYSNGSVDAGVSVMLDKRISGSTMTYWNFGAVFPGDLRGYERVDLKNFLYGAAALETMLEKKLSFVIQLSGQSDIYPETGIAAVDGRAYLIAFGGRYYKGKRSFEFSLTEDLNTTGAPDFIINLTYKLLL